LNARLLWLLAAAPALLQAQMVLYSLDGITPTPLAAVYGYGQVAAGDTKIVRFRAQNTGTASITITLLKVINNTGAGFSIVNSSSTPFVIAPGNLMDFFAGFSATDITSYSATLEVGTASQTLTAILLATVVPAPVLSVAAPCTGPDANATISFGRIVQGTQESCTLSILNPFPQALTVSPLTLSGGAFTTAAGNAVTIAAGQSSSFTILFAPPTATADTATLVVGTRTYTLSGTGFSSPLPSLLWSFDTNAISSGEQHTLSVQLSAPAPVSAAGTLTLAFAPATTVVTDDTAVQFVATSKRVASFTVAAGATVLTINAQPSIVFSTGTTTGTLSFTINPGIFGLSGSPSTSLTTPPALIVTTSTGATSRANELDVVIAGFDNTYSIGPMSFAFVDRSGAPITSLSADFTSSFKAFFQGQTAGSSFLMRASFPVTGDVTKIGGVTVSLSNAAGAVSTPRLNFP
jgi:hypothetical protein